MTSGPSETASACGVLEYRLDEPALDEEDQRYRLITTILDPDQTPANELAALYPQQWKLESALDELKTHQRAARAWCCAGARRRRPRGLRSPLHPLRDHRVMHDAALQADLVPHRLCLHAARRSTRPSRDAIELLGA